MVNPRRSRGGRPVRRVSAAAVRKALLVFVEGDKTEEDYLTYWWRIHRTNVTVTFGDVRGTPRTLIDAAVDAKRHDARNARRGGGAPFDEVWCVCDVDDPPFMHEIRPIAHANDIHLAISNPCIELWLLLHFEPQTAYLKRRDAQSRAKGHLKCEKALTNDALASLEARLARATERAKGLDDKHDGDGSPLGHNPSSRMWEIVDSIRNAGSP